MALPVHFKSHISHPFPSKTPLGRQCTESKAPQLGCLLPQPLLLLAQDVFRASARC